MTDEATSERQPPVERLRGMVDVDPATERRRADVLRRAVRLLASHGYQQVDTPVVEPTDLFLRKSGGERAAQMYAVRFREREIALRPEHTASVLRMYVDSLQAAPLPLRLSYAGPVFRYEKPQSGRTRQFTELGAELLGAGSASADAEVIHLALAVPAAVGIAGELVLGHVGLVLDFLQRLPLRQRARDWLLWSMERVRKGQPVDLDAELAGLVSEDRLGGLFEQMRATVGDVPPDELQGWVMAVLREVGVRMEGGSRRPEEIVAGVLMKMSQRSDEGAVREAFDFLQQLARLEGPAAAVLPQVRDLARRHRLQETPIEELERVLDLLGAYGHDADRVGLNLGLGRGLHYYTGILFEVYLPGSRVQLCGGGRYDDLAQLLGARRRLPACGFSCGLERLVEHAALEPEPTHQGTLVVPAGPGAEAAAIRAAEGLRAQGQVAELETRGRSVQAARRYAGRAGIAEVLVVEAAGEPARDAARPRAPEGRDNA